MRHPHPLRDFPVRPARPFRIFQQHLDRAALVLIAPAQPVAGIRLHRMQDRVTPIALLDLGRDFLAPEPLPCGDPVKAIGQPVILPVMIDRDRREYRVRIGHRLGIIGHGRLMDCGARLRLAVTANVGYPDHQDALLI